MTEKNPRFENRLCKDEKYFNVLNPVWDNKNEDALNVFEMIDLLNDFEIGLNELKVIGDYQAEAIEELEKENEQLKKTLSMYCDAIKSDTRVKELLEDIEELHEENQSIKNHIRELYKIVKVDVDNGIEVYPKVLLEYIGNILKIIGDLE